MAALGALPPDIEPRATEHIAEMIAMISALIANGHAYEADGNVLFDVPSMPDYGRLSGAGFSNEALAFDSVSAYASQGEDDRAELFDSALDDLLEADGDWARLSNTDLGFANLAVAFDVVEATSSNDGDQMDVDPSVRFLVTYGPW